MRAGWMGGIVALMLVPFAAGGLGAAAAGEADAAVAFLPGQVAPSTGPLLRVGCDGNDCNHDGGPNDRRRQWRGQPQPWGGWGQGGNGWNNGWNNGRGNAWDNGWQNRRNGWDNGWQNRGERWRNDWQSGNGDWWGNGRYQGWRRQDEDRYRRRDWRPTGQRQACLERRASHENCSRLPW